jgi:hypothetical protein
MANLVQANLETSAVVMKNPSTLRVADTRDDRRISLIGMSIDLRSAMTRAAPVSPLL